MKNLNSRHVQEANETKNNILEPSLNPKTLYEQRNENFEMFYLRFTGNREVSELLQDINKIWPKHRNRNFTTCMGRYADCDKILFENVLCFTFLW